jgi:hypothetical protein
MMRTILSALLCAIALALLATPVAAAITDVPAGGTVFIGEQGLTIAATGVTAGSQIARFGSGGNVQTDAPSDLVTISDPNSFIVLPSTFGGGAGAWYTWPGRQLAFIVKDPSLQVRVLNDRTGREVGSGFVSGDQLRFRIETNLYSMSQRTGVVGAPITIHVRDPSGAEFTSLENAAGVTTSLVDIPVNVSVYETGPVWTTETTRYRAGTYEVWADCNANGMKDNYNEVGKTTTRTATGAVQIGGTSGPSITVSGTTTATVSPTATTTATAANTTTVATTASPTLTANVTPTMNATVNATPVTTATTRSPGFSFGTLSLLGLAGCGILLIRRR